MVKLVVTGVAGTALWMAIAVPSAWTQGAPKTCSDAYAACTKQTGMAKECETEMQWCVKTGTFADPKTKATTSDLQKR